MTRAAAPPPRPAEGGAKAGRRRRSALLLVTLAALALLVYWRGIVIAPPSWWYPFPVALFAERYTAGPFAMSSNTREDNPVWALVPGFNRTLARLSYVATLGEPRAQIAWLLQEGEWPDAPQFSFFGVDPNRRESATSKALVAAGFEYDRVSRRELGAASADGRALQVGQARYAALLVTDLTVVAPELLERIATLARQGVPVIWCGGFPLRAAGWADHARRDERVRAQGAALEETVRRVAAPRDLATAFAAAGLRAPLTPEHGVAMRLRTHRRQRGAEQFVLLFNESARSVADRYVLDGRYESAELLDPESGAVTATELQRAADGDRLWLSVPARRTRILRLRTLDASAADAGPWQAGTWRSPPRELHPWVRWWWPGNAVDPEELRRELRSLHAAGFGGVELQTLTLGLSRAELRREAGRIYQVGTPAYFANVRAVFDEAARLGLGVDLTLGSGWPGGGPFLERHPEQQLIVSTVDVTGPGAIDLPLPAAVEPGYVARSNQVIPGTVGGFDTDATLAWLLAARIEAEGETPTLAAPQDIGAALQEGRIRWQVPPGRHRLFAIYRNATEHNAAGSAYPGAQQRSPVLDHLDRGGIEEYLAKLGAPWLEALAPHRPAALFVDSFELIAELPWSARFAARFREMHGYEIGPWLPFVFRRGGESKYTAAFAPPEAAYRASDDRAGRIREDYLATREALFREEFLQPLKDWSAARGVSLRLQAHGGYGDYLDAYGLADIPEAESLFAGGSFDFLKLASSAAHVAGRRRVSSESLIVMTLDPDALDIEDYHLLAGNAFAAGINRPVFHGYAYHYPRD